MDSKKPQPLPDKQQPEARVAVPLNVQLEIAKQNQKLAEFRYRTAVRRGRAWIIDAKEEKQAI